MSTATDTVEGSAVDVTDAPQDQPTPAPPPEPQGPPPAALREPGTDVVLSTASTALIVATSPEEMLDKATSIATALDKVIKGQGMRTKMGGSMVEQPDGTKKWEDRYHINVEAWQTLSTLLGLAVVPVSLSPAVDENGAPIRHHFPVKVTRTYKKGKPDENVVTEEYEVDGLSWRSYVEVRKDGALIAAAYGACYRTEDTWKRRDEFALQGMSQTRATSRAIAQAARWIPALAGYAGTPTEEMPAQQDETGPAYGPAAEDLAKASAAVQALAGGDPDRAKIAWDKITEKAGGYMPESVAFGLRVAASLIKPKPSPEAEHAAAAGNVVEGSAVETTGEPAPPTPEETKAAQERPAADTLEPTAENVGRWCICPDLKGGHNHDACPIKGHGIPF